MNPDDYTGLLITSGRGVHLWLPYAALAALGTLVGVLCLFVALRPLGAGLLATNVGFFVAVVCALSRTGDSEWSDFYVWNAVLGVASLFAALIVRGFQFDRPPARRRRLEGPLPVIAATAIGYLVGFGMVAPLVFRLA